MKLLPGFRDFYPADCAARNYILSTWRHVSRQYGFVEYDGPVLESLDLYKKKSGGELVGQLFDFVDKGERHVAMRPEMTPTLARMVAAREKDFRKPLKWFCLPQFFRYEKQQRGRLREFYQFNADILGEASSAADAELIALVIDILRAFGFTELDFVVRVSSRDVWLAFLANKLSEYGEDETRRFFEIVDKLEREDESRSNELLAPFQTNVDELRDWSAQCRARLLDPQFDEAFFHGTTLGGLHSLLHEHLSPRNLLKFVDVDFSIVRGLAYYTGVVFEVFDRAKRERALAGGGRYDGLIALMSDDRVNMPALGFGMGDVVLANLIQDTPHARAKRDAWLASNPSADIYIVIASEAQRANALATVQSLREAGFRTDFSLTPAKIGRQFQAAEQMGSAFAVVVGDEFPQLKLKTLATRQEETLPNTELADRLRTLQNLSPTTATTEHPGTASP